MRIHIFLAVFNPAMAGLVSYRSYIVKSFFPLVNWGRLVKGFYDLYILPLTLPAPDPMLPGLKIAIFHHLVTVGTAGGKRIDSYLPALRHDDLSWKPL
jgi:hypothetical protein